MENSLRLYAVPAPRLGLLITLWRHRHTSRRHLAMLDERELADVGLTRAEQWRECRKRFWDA